MKLTQTTNHGKVRWRVNYHVAGRQHRQFFKTEVEAKKFMRAKDRELAEYGHRWHDISPARRVELIAADDMATEHGFSVKEAVEAHAARIGPRMPSPLLSAAVTSCLSSKAQQGLRAESLAKLRQTLNLLAEAYGERTLPSFTTEMLEEWLAGHGWAPATRKTKRTDLQTFFSWAKARGYVEKNPVEGIAVPLMDDRAPGILSVAACRKLMETAANLDPATCGYFSLCLFAGIRPAEVLRLTASDVDLAGRHVVIAGHKAKSRQRRIVELEPNCVAWCKVGMEMPLRNWRKRTDAVRLAAGVMKEWSHDCMRHSFASYYFALSGSPDKTAGRLGHGSSEMLFRHYRELATPKQAKAFFSVAPAKSSPGSKKPGTGKRL